MAAGDGVGTTAGAAGARLGIAGDRQLAVLRELDKLDKRGEDAVRDTLALAGPKVLGIHLPRWSDFGPILVAWGFAMAVLVFETDLGTSLMFFGLFVVLPVLAQVARRAAVILGPIAVILLVIASAIDGRQRPVRPGLAALVRSPAFLAGLLVLAWSALSVAWTPFPSQAVERLLNVLATVGLTVLAYFALPDRMLHALQVNLRGGRLPAPGELEQAPA